MAQKMKKALREAGIQGINNSFSNLGSAGKVLRAVVPEELCLEIIKHCEAAQSIPKVHPKTKTI